MRPLLVQLTERPLERPCDADWADMRGDDRVRHCSSCQRDVYDLSAMSAREAEIRLLNAGTNAPCIRYVRKRDGSIAHRPEPTRAVVPARTLAQAAALGLTLSAAAVQASPTKKQPDQCVAYASPPQPAPAPPPAAAPAPAPAAAAAPPTPPSEPPPQPLGGAPPPANLVAPQGTLSLKSKVARTVTIIGIKLEAPLATYLLSPGDFIADVRDPDGKTREVAFTIKKDKTTVVDLDGKTKKPR